LTLGFNKAIAKVTVAGMILEELTSSGEGP